MIFSVKISRLHCLQILLSCWDTYWRETEGIFCQKISVTHGAVTPDLVGGTNLLSVWLQKLTVTSEEKPENPCKEIKCTLWPVQVSAVFWAALGQPSPVLRHFPPPAAKDGSPFTLRIPQCVLWSAQQLLGAQHVDNWRDVNGHRPVASQDYTAGF